MGILTKIAATGAEYEKISPSTQKDEIADPDTGRPDRPCPASHPGPTPPYGLHHWRDVYGDWHCTECHPPASLAMVRGEFLVGEKNSELENPQTENSQAGNFRPFVIAVQDPGGAVAFDPKATQAQRREAIEHFEWFDRADARIARMGQCSRRGGLCG